MGVCLDGNKGLLGKECCPNPLFRLKIFDDIDPKDDVEAKLETEEIDATEALDGIFITFGFEAGFEVIIVSEVGN